MSAVLSVEPIAAYLEIMADIRTKQAITAIEAEVPAGGGPFAFDHVSIGVFLTDQPGHHIAIGSDRRAHRPLKAGQGWILPGGVDGLCEFDTDHRFLTVEVPQALIEEAGGTAAFAPHVGALDPLLVQLARSSIAWQGQQTALYRDTMHRALAAHLAQIVAPMPPAAQAIDDKRLARAIARIHDDLAADLTLDDLAGAAAMSPYHFARAFKRATGRSPLQYVIAERIEAAKVLLTTTALPVAEVAHRVGYDDVSRFGHHFRRAAGVTPARYRAR